MSERDIPPSEWPEFLDDFSRRHRAWLATIDSESPGSPHLEVERPLRAVTPTLDADRVVAIEVRFQDYSQPSMFVRIGAPVRVRVDETIEGTAQGLEIVDEEGGATRIRFRAAPPAETLDGVVPGELYK